MNYRWINYPKDIDQRLKERYEALADKLEAEAAEPIALVWAHENEDWNDDDGIPERNCLLVMQHIQDGDEWSFGPTIATHRLQ